MKTPPGSPGGVKIRELDSNEARSLARSMKSVCTLCPEDATTVILIAPNQEETIHGNQTKRHKKAKDDNWAIFPVCGKCYSLPGRNEQAERVFRVHFEECVNLYSH